MLRELRSSAIDRGPFSIRPLGIGTLEISSRLRTRRFGRDREIGQDHQVIDSLIFDGGNDGDVDVAGAQLLGALGRHGEAEFVLAGEETMRESPDERRGVEVLDDGDAKFWQGRSFLGLLVPARNSHVAKL